MDNDSFMSKMRSFFGLHPQPPRNDFRNPIWGSDDDDDGDELYSRQQMDMHPHLDLHQEITRHMQDMFRSFGGMFGDMKSLFNDDFKSLFDQDDLDYEYAGSVPQLPADNDNFNSNSIRDYYLKPGFHSRKPFEQKDVDLDGKISSQEISGLLKRQEAGNEKNPGMVMPFDGTKVPGRSFCKTIITTSVTKSDGTIETRRIVKSGNDIIEETTTSSGPDSRGPSSPNPGINTISSTGISTGILLSEFASIFKNFY